MQNPRSPGQRAVLAYFIYGDRPAYQAEAAFSIATAKRLLGSHADDVEIVLVTDQVQLSRAIDARRIHVTQDELAQWTANGRYNHRAKLCALRRVLAEDVRAVALVDTDTYFVADPRRLLERIRTDQCVMHAAEGPLGQDSEWQPVFQDVTAAARLQNRGCTPATEMFNSGVIGVEKSQSQLVDDALAWLDSEVDHVRAFNLEQVAVSVALQQKCAVAVCDDLLVHYWGHARAFIHVQIGAALRANSSAVDGFGIPRIALRHRLQGRALGLLLRWNEECRFAYQAALSALASTHDDGHGYALAWAETAVTTVERVRDVYGTQPVDVRGLKSALSPLARADFMPATLRARWEQLWQAPRT